MSHSLVRRAFEDLLKAWADAQSPSVSVAFQNVEFAPPAAAYLRAFLIPAGTASDDLAGQHRRFEGVYQVTVFAPAGTGPKVAQDMADAVAALFPVASPLTVSGQKVFLLSPMSQGPSIQESGWFSTPLSCAYRLDTIS